MPTSRWHCDECGEDYDSEEQALDCEDDHLSPAERSHRWMSDNEKRVRAEIDWAIELICRRPDYPYSRTKVDNETIVWGWLGYPPPDLESRQDIERLCRFAPAIQAWVNDQTSLPEVHPSAVYGPLLRYFSESAANAIR